MTNRIRGEVEVRLGDKTYVMRPEHERAVRLDDALPKGVFGTLVDLSRDNVAKVATLATIVYHLTDDPPPIENIKVRIFRGSLADVATSCADALSAIAVGTDRLGEGEGQESPATDSTGDGD